MTPIFKKKKNLRTQIKIAPAALARGSKALCLEIGGLVYRLCRRVVRNVSYGEHPRLKLDIYLPRISASPAPVLVFVHGGSFQRFNKNIHGLVGRAFKRQGFLAVLLNYRLFPQVRYPFFVEDVAQALRWVKEKIAAYGGDRQAIFLCGHSAGGLIALLLALDGQRYGLAPGTIQAAISISSPYNYDHPFFSQRHWLAIMNGAENLRGPAQPIKLTGEKISIPLLLLHGEADQVISTEDARSFFKALQAQGADVHLVSFRSRDHYGTVFALTRTHSDVTDEIASFIRKRLLEPHS
jgi:acetyl esterase/lipase